MLPLLACDLFMIAVSLYVPAVRPYEDTRTAFEGDAYLVCLPSPTAATQVQPDVSSELPAQCAQVEL